MFTFLYFCAALATSFHMSTLVVFALDSKLRSGGGNIFMVFVIIQIVRNSLFVISVHKAIAAVHVLYLFSECMSACCQIKMSQRFWKKLTSNRVTVNSSMWDNMCCQFLIVIGLSVLYTVFWFFFLWFMSILQDYFEFHLKTYLAVAGWTVPLITLNTGMCVVTALRIRRQQKTLEIPDSRRHCGADIQWTMLLLKVTLLCGVQNDLTVIIILVLKEIASYENHQYAFYIVFSICMLRGWELFFIFVCKKEVWSRIRSKF